MTDQQKAEGQEKEKEEEENEDEEEARSGVGGVEKEGGSAQ
jgi:hypothetical protein